MTVTRSFHREEYDCYFSERASMSEHDRLLDDVDLVEHDHLEGAAVRGDADGDGEYTCF